MRECFVSAFLTHVSSQKHDEKGLGRVVQHRKEDTEDERSQIMKHYHQNYLPLRSSGIQSLDECIGPLC